MGKYNPAPYQLDLKRIPHLITESLPGPKSNAMHARAVKHYRGLSGQVKLFPVAFERGSGCLLEDVDGLVVPGGFGSRGLEGKMCAIQYARLQGIPFLGLCLGMQMAVVEFARHVLDWRDAHTTEVEPHTTYPVIDLMKDQDLGNLGGTMRLGKYRCTLTPGTHSARAYGVLDVSERHRHRYEFNNEYLDRFTAAGMVIAGRNPDRNLVEIVEIPDHPFFVGVQFHPELKSRPNRPNPLFRDFIGAALRQQEKEG